MLGQHDWRKLSKGVCFALLGSVLLFACSEDRTQLMLLVDTDMTQGGGAALEGITIRVFSGASTEPSFSQGYDLGPAVRLPTTLAIVPDSETEGRVAVEVDALGANRRILFTKRVEADYQPERTLRLDLFLAGRCVDATANACPEGTSCGLAGCEENLRRNLPPWEGKPTPDAQVAPPDGSVDAPSDGSVDATRDGDSGAPPIPPPRPIRPASGTMTTSRTVSFQWALAPDTNGARIDICRERTCDTVVESMEVDGTEADVTLAPEPTPASRVYYFRLVGRRGAELGEDASAMWSFSVHGRPSVAAGTSWGSIYDFDGDGLAEVFAAAPMSATVQGYRGRNPAGSSPGADYIFEAPAELGFGTTVTSAGDVNGDGFLDLAIGSRGSIFVYHGGAGAIPAAAGTTDAATTLVGTSLERQSVDGAGDIDGDGYADLVVGEPTANRVLIYSGGPGGLSTTGVPFVRTADASFGTAVAGGCDLNRDGYADVLVSASDKAFAVMGSDIGLGEVVELLAGAGARGFGQSLACGGDLDGDGFVDALVGAPIDGAVFVYSGSESGPSTNPAAAVRKVPGDVGAMTKHGASFGRWVASAGDVNGDDISDLVVVAPDEATGLRPSDFVGYAFLFHGRPSGLGLTGPGDSTNHQRALGASMMFAENRTQAAHYAGDVNGDGFGDLVVGLPARSGGAGGVFLHLGSAAGVPTASNWTLEGGALQGYGTVVAFLGHRPGTLLRRSALFPRSGRRSAFHTGLDRAFRGTEVSVGHAVSSWSLDSRLWL
ncbi:MAG: FG-GAP-like repeat-containing protein [Myxococcota bacterium]